MEKMDFYAAGLKQLASGEKKQLRKLFKHLQKIKPATLDRMINSRHDQLMSKVNCLECANCCKSISPALIDRDVDRISKHLRMKPSELVETYLELDADGDYVFRKQPCPFLGDDNYCAIYDVRPRACREYPHTDRSKQHQIMDVNFRNISVCPVVFQIAQDLKNEVL